ncbi:serine hydrolase domain-containing protein [Nonomuraea sp. LPB2021202275-12-8]|uniref:serine hydrolase domain-containing protein n=1 Tax=Nonomuraea sp. LPB2021202275-12-8 TaxID=3120159 RepID=UPI00300D2633
MTTNVNIQHTLDQAVTDGGVPGIAVEIRNGKDVWFGSAGVADTGTDRKRHQADQFRIGSTTKSFTATVVLQLAAEYKLSLDDTVEQWLPSLVQGNGHDGSKVTIRHLLNQTSGIYNYALDPEMLEGFFNPGFLEHRFDRWRPEQLVGIAMKYAPYHQPGEAFKYSNANYMLLGMIIEKATGASYADQVTWRIIQPLGLTGTYVPGNDETELRGQHVRHYSKNTMDGDPAAEIHDVTEINPSFAWAAGGIVSTVSDLNRYFQSLLGGSLLAPAQQEELLTTVSTASEQWIPDTRYGAGMFEQNLPCGVTLYGAAGMINGSYVYTMGSRDGKRLITVHINADWIDQGHPIATLTGVIEAGFCTHAPVGGHEG